MLSKGTKTCIQYWLVDRLAYPTLRQVAIDVFIMVISTAASERGFSAMGFVHSKLRNRLSADKVEKLVFIKNNALQLMSTHQVGIDWGGTDDDDDEEGIKKDECIIDDKGSRIVVDELDTIELNKLCSKSIFVDNCLLTVKNWVFNGFYQYNSKTQPSLQEK